MSQTESPIQNISDTARWVAMYRAYESERPDAHFQDPFARRLAGPRGEDIVRSLPGGRMMAWAMVVRTVLFDELLIRLVREEGADTVVNLAAGLDARPWRLDLPAPLRWMDVDLPEILDYKRRELADATPRCRYEARACDLRDAAARRALFDEVSGSATKVLILTEGLLIYLTEEQVADLARDLAAPASFRWWVIDIAGPELLKRLRRRWGRRLAEGNAPFRFGPAAGTGFFAPFGWREREFRSTWEESRRLRREMPLAWFWRLLGRFASPARRKEWPRFAGIVLLERR